MNGQSFVPIREGDEIDVTIEAVGEKGDGLAKKDGFVIFVPNTKQGDKVRIRITRVLRKVGFGEVVGQAEATEEAPAEPETGEAEATEEPAEETAEGAEETPTEAEEVPPDTEDFGEEAK